MVKAKRFLSSNQDPLVFELHDIFEDIVFDVSTKCPQNACHVLRSNIKDILMREKLWNRSFSIIFPMGSNRVIDVENNFYEFDFSIYSKLHEAYIAHGTCFGYGNLFKANETKRNTPIFEVVDMQVDIPKYNLSRLREKIIKEVVVFT